jgi:flagellar basal-body rod modification protein FlgD
MTVSAASPVATPVASASPGSAATATGATQGLNYNDFLTLLMAEMKNQDPTQPMDPSQMVSQLATVSEVGQAVATSLSQAEQLVGRTITSADGSTSGQVASVSVASTGAVATLTNGATVPLANGASVQ